MLASIPVDVKIAAGWKHLMGDKEATRRISSFSLIRREEASRKGMNRKYNNIVNEDPPNIRLLIKLPISRSSFPSLQADPDSDLDRLLSLASSAANLPPTGTAIRSDGEVGL